MILKNAQFVAQMWHQFCDIQRLALVEIRHANKADNKPRGGLSARGEEQASLMGLTIGPVLHSLTARRGMCRFYSSNTGRCFRTIWHLIATFHNVMDPETLISIPKELDIPYLGPNDEDAKTCTKVAEKLGISRNEAFALNWQKYGFKRLGEAPTASSARIQRGLTELLIRQPNDVRVVIYCGNSPVMNEAVGIPGVMAEMEALFFTHENGQFQLLGRAAPEFSD